jgi:hypothetical protein
MGEWIPSIGSLYIFFFALFPVSVFPGFIDIQTTGVIPVIGKPLGFQKKLPGIDG